MQTAPTPIFKDVNQTISINSKEININQIIFRPVLKRIVVISDNTNRTIVYEGEELYNQHKDDTNEQIIEVFKTKIS